MHRCTLETSIKRVFGPTHILPMRQCQEGKRDRGTISGTHMGESSEQKARLEPPQPIESTTRMLEARGI